MLGDVAQLPGKPTLFESQRRLPAVAATPLRGFRVCRQRMEANRPKRNHAQLAPHRAPQRPRARKYTLPPRYQSVHRAAGRGDWALRRSRRGVSARQMSVT